MTARGPTTLVAKNKLDRAYIEMWQIVAVLVIVAALAAWWFSRGEGYAPSMCSCREYDPGVPIPPTGTASINHMLPSERTSPNMASPTEPDINPSDYFARTWSNENFQVDWDSASWHGFKPEVRYEPDHVPLTG